MIISGGRISFLLFAPLRSFPERRRRPIRPNPICAKGLLIRSDKGESVTAFYVLLFIRGAEMGREGGG